ncbi:MAG: hypothetical protein V2A71_02490 [Candidatus Eisenbacteria bacterium]
MGLLKGLRCLNCGESLIRESPITPVGAAIFEHQTDKPRLRCPACGRLNVVRWDPEEGFQAITIVDEDSEGRSVKKGLYCLSCGSKMELCPPPWEKPAQIIEARDRTFAVCGTCGGRNQIETVEGKTIAVKLA